MRNNNAFTLLEMLVALAVASVLMLGIFGMAGRMGQSVEKNNAILQQDMSIFTAIAQFEKDLMGYNGNMLSANPFTLQFKTLKGLYAGQAGSGQAQIIYQIEPTTDGKARLLRREMDPVFTSQTLSSTVLEADAMSFTLRNENGREKSPWDNPSAAPAAVSLMIDTGGGRIWTRTVPILVRTP